MKRSGNMTRHLKFKHPKTYMRMQQAKKKYNEESFLSKADLGWFKTYVTKISALLYKCNVCEAVLKQVSLNKHMEQKHPDILEKERAVYFLDMNTINEEEMENCQKKIAKPEDDARSRNIYFKKLERDSYICKICGDKTKNTEGHLAEKHFRMQLSKKGNNLDSKTDSNKGWVRKYVTRYGPNAYECDVCKKVLSTPRGFIGNMLRHFKLLHPYICAKETDQHLLLDFEEEVNKEQDTKYLDSNAEEEVNKEQGTEYLDSDAEEELNKKQGTKYLDSNAEEETNKEQGKAATRSKTIVKRGWVRKYVNRLGFKEHECIVCKKVLSLPHGLIGNMRRHFKNIHPSIYARENYQRINVFEDDKDNKESGDNEKEIYKTAAKQLTKQGKTSVASGSSVVEEREPKESVYKEVESHEDVTEEVVEKYIILQEGDGKDVEDFEIEYLDEDTPANNSTKITERD